MGIVASYVWNMNGLDGNGLDYDCEMSVIGVERL